MHAFYGTCSQFPNIFMGQKPSHHKNALHAARIIDTVFGSVFRLTQYCFTNWLAAWLLRALELATSAPYLDSSICPTFSPAGSIP